MEIRLSENLHTAVPDLPSELQDIARVAQELDREIALGDLYVEARCSRYYDGFFGTAHPQTSTIYRRDLRYVYHPDGKITMSIGIDTTFDEVVRLFAHELRHIGQFHRGRCCNGHLTIAPLSGRAAEKDAYEFEEYVLGVLV